jgi:hypothetical protein
MVGSRGQRNRQAPLSPSPKDEALPLKGLSGRKRCLPVPSEEYTREGPRFKSELEPFMFFLKNTPVKCR